jgi:hypothetical protein
MPLHFVCFAVIKLLGGLHEAIVGNTAEAAHQSVTTTTLQRHQSVTTMTLQRMIKG